MKKMIFGAISFLLVLPTAGQAQSQCNQTFFEIRASGQTADQSQTLEQQFTGLARTLFKQRHFDRTKAIAELVDFIAAQMKSGEMLWKVVEYNGYREAAYTPKIFGLIRANEPVVREEGPIYALQLRTHFFGEKTLEVSEIVNALYKEHGLVLVGKEDFADWGPGGGITVVRTYGLKPDRSDIH